MKRQLVILTIFASLAQQAYADESSTENIQSDESQPKVIKLKDGSGVVVDGVLYKSAEQKEPQAVQAPKQKNIAKRAFGAYLADRKVRKENTLYVHHSGFATNNNFNN